MVTIFAISKPIVWLLMKFYGLSPQIIETEPETQIKMCVPSKTKSRNKPNVVFLHGFAADGIFSWMSQVVAISSTYAVYVPDLLFFGGSFTDKPGRSTTFQAEVVVAALRKVGVKKCTVVGLSYGAAVGFKMAKLDPELVEFVVASDTIIELNVLEKYGFDSFVDFLLPSTVEGLMKFLTIANHGPVNMPLFVAKDFLREFFTNRKEIVELAEAWVTLDNEVNSISLSQVCYFDEFHLVWGDDDKVFNSTVAEKTKMQLGGDTTLHYIEDEGHTIQMEKLDLYNTELKRILTSFYTKTKEC
ncbi:AB hydrolase-1 domain-containing protein [Heracleum sosnowskyi]|uniref:AB hydrolase-1 domain-containing protein n=1 Tax=Heracleum sosnowskyi TaxID=360622 RepID=A0AAD8I7M0_9APIA|nr:AB hydrolase-1 domain-containing protein [Heracleum sosnowskyi]